jgi:hypothetical protein
LIYGSSPEELQVFEGYAYFIGDDSFRVVDLSVPTNPVEVANLLDSHARDMIVTEDRAYLLNGGALRIIDVSDPTLPFVLSDTSVPAYGWAFAAGGTQVYVAENFEGNTFLYRIDLTDPESPLFEETMLYEDEATALRVVDDRLYISGLRGVTVLDPLTLRQVEFFGEQRFAYDVFTVADSGRLYGLQGGDAFHVLDTKPLGYVMNGHTPNRYTYGIAEVGGAVYVTDREGLHVFDLPCTPTSVDDIDVTRPGFRGLHALPNPTSSGTEFVWTRPEPDTIGFGGSSREAARIRLFDTTERMIRSATLAEGSERFYWDGRDESGNLIPSGVIWAQIQWRGRVSVETVRIIR